MSNLLNTINEKIINIRNIVIINYFVDDIIIKI